MKTKLLLLTALSIFLYRTVYAQITEEALMTNLQGILDSKIPIYGMEGAAVAIVFPSDNIHTITSGYATSISDPVDVNKKWHWASATKPLTGYIILDMYEEGLLDINGPISNYIDTDTIPNVSGTILIKDLLQHTSPLQEIWEPAQTALWNAVWNDRTRVWCPWEVLSYMPLPNDLNTTHHYNNSNSYMLGFIIEAITGQDLETVFQDRIFTPLGMTNSYLASCDPFDMNELNGVWNGTQNRSTWSHTSYLSSRGGNSALISTVADVAKFYNTYYQGDLLTPAVMDHLRVPAVGSRQYAGAINCATAFYTEYGFETTILEVTTADTTYHFYGHGGNGVNNCVAFYWQEEDITIVIVNNDYTTTNALAALFTDIACEIIDNLPIQNLSVGDQQYIESNIFPNPAQEDLTIKLENSSYDNGRFTLRDLNGRTILKSQLNGQKTTVSLADLSTGVYIYELAIDGRSKIGKIIKD